MEKCDVCGEEFDSEEGLLTHTKQAHAQTEVDEPAMEHQIPELEPTEPEEAAAGRGQ